MIQSVLVAGAAMLRPPALGCLVTFIAQVLTAGSPVGVYLEFEVPPSATALEAMQNEASRLLEGVGTRIAWRLVSENQGNEAFERLVVVKLTGGCGCGGFLPATREILVLGTTAVADGKVLPYSQVRCDAVRRLLPEIEHASDRRQSDAVLGRVLGRILAHELYHALLGTVHHAPSGLAKGFHSTLELKSGELPFDGGDWELEPAGTR